MKNFKLSDILKPVIVLTAICLITSALLAYTNDITKDKIAQQNVIAAQEAQKKVLSQAVDFETVNEGKADEYIIGKAADGTIVGYVFTTTDKSYGGDIEVMVGIKPDGTVNAVEILTISDTPGLGMNAKNATFLDQFIGKIKDIGVNKNEPAENEIKALTGATITSSAVTRAVNTALAQFETVTGGAENG